MERADVAVRCVTELLDAVGYDLPTVELMRVLVQADALATGIWTPIFQAGTAILCFKQAYIDATEDDVVLIHSPAGLPGRAIRNPFVARYLEGNVTSSPCFANCLTHCRYRKTRETFCIAAALVEAFKGNWEEGLFFCGSNVSRVKKIEKVSEVISELFPE